MLLAMKGQQELVNPKGFFLLRENYRVSSLDKRLYRSKHQGAIVCREPFRGNPQKKMAREKQYLVNCIFFVEAWWAHTTGSLMLFFCWGGETAAVVALAKGFNVGRLPKA